MTIAPRATPWALALVLAAVFLTGPAWLIKRMDAPAERLLLAPMFNLLEPCVQAPARPVKDAPASVAQWCGEKAISLAPVVEKTLSALGPRLPEHPHLELGYTLPIPLLRLLKPEGTDWRVDRSALQKFVRTLRDTDRPAVVYLFATHFGVHAPIESVLARDPDNLLTTQKGPLPVDGYYGDPVFPWSFARTDNGITARRLQVIDAFLEEVCQLPPADRQKIRAITMLGETHQMFPRLESGMGYAAPYLITDYSEASQRDFRQFLKLRFRHINALNRAIGADYRSFSEVQAPSKDIRTEPLSRYTEHIDAYAHGSFPVAGWVHVPGLKSGETAWVQIYRNGVFQGRVPVRGGRQDVAAAHPEFGTADLGWQVDLDFRTLAVGIHRLDILLETPGQALQMLDTRRIAVMGREQVQPPELPYAPLPTHQKAVAGVLWATDGPADQQSFFYNPLATWWHEFRGQQVARYLEFIDGRIRHSCLSNTALYTHQILPFINPGWDKNRFAVEASLRPTGRTQTGISLYGDATYGANFANWMARSGLRHYGVTEFHPLKAMSTDEVDQMLEQHRQRGAQFVSFFVEPLGLTPGHGAAPNLFSFDPERSEFGSSQLYESTKAVLHQGMPR